MKQIIKQEGYSLLFTLILLTLFSVLGISLITLTGSGLSKNEIRQDIVQSEDLSDKGIDRITKTINKDLTDALGDNGLIRREFISKLEETLDKYKCGGTNVLKKDQTNGNVTGEYQVCIVNFENTFDEKGIDNPLRKLVTFSSVGSAGHKISTLTSKFEIGAKTVPDALNYAIGVHKTCSNSKNCLNGEGNLFLHGAVSIVGDMKVDNDLIISNKGYGSGVWIPTLYPTTQALGSSRPARLVLGGAVYSFTSNSIYYDTHTQRKDFSSYNKITDLKDAFRKAPELVEREPIRDKVEITEQKVNFLYKINDFNVTKIFTGTNSTSISNLSYSNKKVFPYYTKRYSCGRSICESNETEGEFEITGNNTVGQFATDGNLTIKSSTKTLGLTKIQSGMYVNGNLTIGNNSTSNYPVDYDKIELDGPIYVNGNLTIRGADAKLNSLIYVNGSVTIQHSVINGLPIKDKDGKTVLGSLIIFANKDINVSNFSRYLTEPSNINGYFYSENEIEMYGVGTNIVINGGISARKIILNAMQGKVDDRFFPDSTYTKPLYHESLAAQKLDSSKSRLQIIYNPEIIDRYSDLKQKEPIIHSVDPPLEKVRHY